MVLRRTEDGDGEGDKLGCVVSPSAEVEWLFGSLIGKPNGSRFFFCSAVLKENEEVTRK
jgi:hypothetical protein